MKKISYDTLEAEKVLEEFNNSKINDPVDILLQIAKIYKLEKPIVMDVTLDDSDFTPYYKIKMKDQIASYKNCYVAISEESRVPVLVKFEGKDYSDVFELYKGTLFLDAKLYSNEKKKIVLEKKYNSEGHDYTIPKNNLDYVEFNYFYRNQYINCEIIFQLPKKIAFQYNLFPRFILNNEEEIKDMISLCEVVKNIIGSNDTFIFIENHIGNARNEKIEVKNGIITAYDGYQIENKNKVFIEYYKDITSGHESYKVTREENPVNELLDGIRKKVGGK